MQKTVKRNFSKIEKYVVVKGENYNQDRCLNVPVILDNIILSITLCMDELDEVARVCQINGEDITSDQELLLIRVVKEIGKESDIAVYSKKEDKDYRYYLEEIKMSSECCDGDCTSCFNCKFEI